MRKKNQDHNDWYKLFQISMQSLKNFILENHSIGVTFNFNGQDKWDILLDGKVSETPRE